jgi:HEAT repeat protein
MRLPFFLFAGVLAATGCARTRPAPPAPFVADAASQAGAAQAPAPAEELTIAYSSGGAVRWAEQLNDRNLVAQHQAAMALRELGAEGFPHLLDGLQSDAAETRLLCLQALPRTLLLAHADRAFRLLLRLLHDPNTQVRLLAIQRIVWLEHGGRDALSYLRQLAGGDRDNDVRTAAAEAVRLMTDLPVEKKPPQVQELTQAALQGLRSEKTEERLMWLRQGVTTPLLLAVAEDAVPLLIRLLRDESASVRQHAARRLGDLGGRAKTALHALHSVAHNDTDPAVRAVAAAAATTVETAVAVATPRVAPPNH